VDTGGEAVGIAGVTVGTTTGDPVISGRVSAEEGATGDTALPVTCSDIGPGVGEVVVQPTSASSAAAKAQHHESAHREVILSWVAGHGRGCSRMR